jgi:GNAT superfamily N-acetyltransferase
MPYELGITEVGPAEYPLLEVLRETIFSEFGHRSLTSFAEILDGRRDVLTLIAHLEGNPIGFKVGCGDRPGVYHSRSGGVLKDYRRLGLGRRMQEWQHQFALARGYKQIYFNTFNHFRDMIRFGLASGFRPVGAEWRELDAMSFKFVKKLTGPSPEFVAPDTPEASLIDDRAEVDHRDVRYLHRLIAEGFNLAGMRHDAPTGGAVVILERPAIARAT